jgi:hypothetical protein
MGGRPAQAPNRWPAASSMRLGASQPTLVIFLNPGCPCSEASVHELGRTLGACQGRVKAYAVFPTGDEVKGMPGLTAVTDTQAREAGLFQAFTSGQALLYSQTGSLLFQGGLTAGRGSQAVVALVLHRARGAVCGVGGG